MDERIEKRKEYRRLWMREWRKNNKVKAAEIRKNYWRRKLEKEDKKED